MIRPTSADTDELARNVLKVSMCATRRRRSTRTPIILIGFSFDRRAEEKSGVLSVSFISISQVTWNVLGRKRWLPSGIQRREKRVLQFSSHNFDPLKCVVDVRLTGRLSVLKHIEGLLEAAQRLGVLLQIEVRRTHVAV